ncbi:hypothetical protein G5I_11670 [Acromyrmex echinatior]|uniref:Uncharacterized protein n=1 Tax=Acromyrmex echinatior TaxID=103372 RepID=F4X063_ACREC|nr:hypothetical protein G5I_11670 [Acromyrmex echinatior]
MNERMAHFLTAPYMSIYYNAGSAEIPPRTEGETALSDDVHPSPVSPAPTKQEPDVSIHRTDLFSTTRPMGLTSKRERKRRGFEYSVTTKHRFHRRESDNTDGGKSSLSPLADSESRFSLLFLSSVNPSLSPLAVPLSNVSLDLRANSLLSLPVESRPPGLQSASGHCWPPRARTSGIVLPVQPDHLSSRKGMDVKDARKAQRRFYVLIRTSSTIGVNVTAEDDDVSSLAWLISSSEEEGA